MVGAALILLRFRKTSVLQQSRKATGSGLIEVMHMHQVLLFTQEFSDRLSWSQLALLHATMHCTGLSRTKVS
jgi:hypothetical protein